VPEQARHGARQSVAGIVGQAAKDSPLAVAGLPIGLAAILFVIAPSFFQPMFDKPPDLLGIPVGVILLIVGGTAMFIGFQLIRKIVDIEV